MKTKYMRSSKAISGMMPVDWFIKININRI